MEISWNLLNHRLIMKKSTLYFMFLHFFFISCGEKSAIKESEIIKSVETEIIKIVDIHANTHIDISSLLDTIKYVKLELTEESIIGYIQKITIYEDRIYILDTQTSSLFVFDINGNYLFKIDRRGAGPEEYIQLDFFDIDFRNNEIMLTDLMGYWVMKYDMDGNFISREKIPFRIEGIAPGFDNGYAVYANYRDNKTTMKQEYNLIYLDSLMNITKAYFPYLSTNIRFATPQASVFYPYNENFHFFSLYGNNIYKIGKEGLSLVYSFDFGDKSFDISSLEKQLSPQDYVKKKDFYLIHRVQETDHILSFTLSEPSSIILYQGFYSKETKKLLYPIFYTLDKEVVLEIPSIAYDSWLITELSIDDLLSWREKIDHTLFKNQFLWNKKILADQLTIDDNPVLMFYKLKSF